MSDTTRQALEEAVRAHVADESEGAYVTAWHMVAHGVVPTDVNASTYVYATSDGGPHEWLGLIDMAHRRGMRWQHEEDT